MVEQVPPAIFKIYTTEEPPVPCSSPYQSLQVFPGAILSPAEQWKAAANSSMLARGTFTRQGEGKCPEPSWGQTF